MCAVCVLDAYRDQRRALDPMDVTVEVCLVIECIEAEMFSMSECPVSSEHFFYVLKAA